MCQYNDRCPTTKHRPGTVCPLEVRDANRKRKQIAQLWSGGIVLAIGLIALIVYLVVR